LTLTNFWLESVFRTFWTERGLEVLDLLIGEQDIIIGRELEIAHRMPVRILRLNDQLDSIARKPRLTVHTLHFERGSMQFGDFAAAGLDKQTIHVLCDVMLNLVLTLPAGQDVMRLIGLE
jgi:hypothetical protein